MRVGFDLRRVRKDDAASLNRRQVGLRRARHRRRRCVMMQMRRVLLLLSGGCRLRCAGSLGRRDDALPDGRRHCDRWPGLVMKRLSLLVLVLMLVLMLMLMLMLMLLRRVL